MADDILARIRAIAKHDLTDRQFEALKGIQEFSDEDDWRWYPETYGVGRLCPLRWLAYLERYPVEGKAPEECATWEPDALSRQGYTYFALGLCDGAIKIGQSRSPEYRVSQLGYEQKHQPSEMLVYIPGGYLERSYHRVFSRWHFGHEWFAPHPDILAEIARLTPARMAGAEMMERDYGR